VAAVARCSAGPPGWARPDEVAKAAVFLAVDDSSYVHRIVAGSSMRHAQLGIVAEMRSRMLHGHPPAALTVERRLFRPEPSLAALQSASSAHAGASFLRRRIGLTGRKYPQELPATPYHMNGPPTTGPTGLRLVAGL